MQGAVLAIVWMVMLGQIDPMACVELSTRRYEARRDRPSTAVWCCTATASIWMRMGTWTWRTQERFNVLSAVDELEGIKSELRQG